jgi:hypothetical protein
MPLLRVLKKVLDASLFWAVFGQVAMWANFIRASKQHWSVEGPIAGALYIFTILVMANFVVKAAMDARATVRDIAELVLYLLSLVLVDSALLYYTSGTTKNWSQHLSHFDAIFVSIGTLTTAGTSGISAKSTLAHGLLTGQMIVDFVAVTFVIGAALQRLTPRTPSDRVGADDGTRPQSAEQSS